MALSIPVVLNTLSTTGSAIKEILAWKKTAKGNTWSLVSELKDNLEYLDMVAEDGVKLDDVIDSISTSEYKRLSKEGFNFNTLKREKIDHHTSLKETNLSSWAGKETEALIESIYEKINNLKIKYRHVSDNKKYRWNVRVNSIRKRIWLLLKHVRS